MTSRLGDYRRRVWPLILVIVLADPAAADVTIALTGDVPPQVAVRGLPQECLAALAEARLDRAAWERVFSVRVAQDQTGNVPAVLGSYQVVNEQLVFTPRYPLKPGVKYLARFNAGAMLCGQLGEQSVAAELTVAALPSTESAVVDAVFPSSDVLPENQLKFYIHFSAPMTRGDAYRHIQLLDDKGRPVDAPFLELAEELWDAKGQRLTLLLDPGRVKRDLKPHMEVGRALTAGGQYTLVITNDWRDARGNPLGAAFRKEFRVVEADVRQPDPQKWQLTAPRASTREPLVVQFGEPLDHAMLEHVIHVANPANKPVEGQIIIDEHETRWSFRPTNPWIEGNHRLLVDGMLEDLAGNSIARPFEVYLPERRPAELSEFALPFQISSKTISDSSAEQSRP